MYFVAWVLEIDMYAAIFMKERGNLQFTWFPFVAKQIRQYEIKVTKYIFFFTLSFLRNPSSKTLIGKIANTQKKDWIGIIVSAVVSSGASGAMAPPLF